MGIGGSGGATVGGSRLQWRVCFWHELLSCAGSADDPCRLRLCFVPQTARSAALPPLFAARLAGLPSQPVAHDEIWQLLLEVRAPATLTQLLYAMRVAYEGVWRALPAAPQSATPQWQLPLFEHAAACDRAVADAAAEAEAAEASDLRGEGGALLRALRHFCAYHDVALRPSVREHLRAQLSTSGGRQATLELSQLLRLPHTSPPPYVDLTPRRLSAHLDGTMQAPPRQPLASVPEVRAVAAAMSCCGGVASVHAVDVRLSEDCVTALGEALRYSPRLATLSLNHVLPNTASARAALGVLIDALPRCRAPLTSLDLAHNALLEEATLLRLVAALRTLPSALHSLNLDGCGLAPRSVLPLCALLCEPGWSTKLWSLSLAHNSLGKDDGTHALAQTLRRTTALLELDVTGAHLDLAAVVDALVSNETLATQLSLLHLGTNKLSRAAALQLAEFVSLSRALRGLGISRTQLLPEGFEPILAAALANPNLDGLALDASENELGERCAKAIAQHLLGAAKTPAQPQNPSTWRAEICRDVAGNPRPPNQWQRD